MVDVETVTTRLGRLAQLLEQLERSRARGPAAYAADEDLRAATERRLQLAEQICIAVGVHVLSELNARPPNDYADIFASLAEAGRLDPALAPRLAHAAGQRDLLVHAYLEVDDRKILASLEQLDDLRAFAAAIQRLIDTEPGAPGG